LPGVTRARLLRLAAHLDLQAVEEPLTLERLTDAEVIVLTSALRLAVAGRLEPGPVDETVVSAVASVLHGSTS
jgi:branched-subunit amino acid aminotransferase/4-amino-4-deoxychorismate lyase